jgi:hypothetical protein
MAKEQRAPDMMSGKHQTVQTPVQHHCPRSSRLISLKSLRGAPKTISGKSSTLLSRLNAPFMKTIQRRQILINLTIPRMKPNLHRMLRVKIVISGARVQEFH